jgi:hypothetical protein
LRRRSSYPAAIRSNTESRGLVYGEVRRCDKIVAVRGGIEIEWRRRLRIRSRVSLRSAIQLTTFAEKQVSRFLAIIDLRNFPCQPHFDCEPRRLLTRTSPDRFGVRKALVCCFTLQNICLPDCQPSLKQSFKHQLASGVQLGSALPATETLCNVLFATLQLLMTPVAS